MKLKKKNNIIVFKINKSKINVNLYTNIVYKKNNKDLKKFYSKFFHKLVKKLYTLFFKNNHKTTVLLSYLNTKKTITTFV